MVLTSSFLAFSAFTMGALAQPNKANGVHRTLIDRAASASSASIPKATTWDPPSGMVKGLDQVSKT